VVDGTGLENRHTRKGIGGSNPSLSAIYSYAWQVWPPFRFATGGYWNDFANRAHRLPQLAAKGIPFRCHLKRFMPAASFDIQTTPQPPADILCRNGSGESGFVA
jgi:hypothetical protein